MPTTAELAAWLLDADSEQIVRRTAHWMYEARKWPTEGDLDDPNLTDDPVVDALVAAVAESLALRRGEPSPPWTSVPDRFLDHFWYPGPESLFAWALAHSPTPFSIRGILIEADSLESV